MEVEDFKKLQTESSLSDRKIAEALGVTRQTWRNWRSGRVCPVFVQNAMRWLLAIRQLDPNNDNIPSALRNPKNG